ncbi:MAG: polyhydroxyalkanoate depolymerase [Alphaproteobacteria bacterium]|nr:polyhydroxyalkanoate depolymerase [Alphaproteobacteria bacterium]
MLPEDALPFIDTKLFPKGWHHLFQPYAYQTYENMRRSLAPLRMMTEFGQYFLNHPMMPTQMSMSGRSMSAGLEVLERITRDYRKPEFNITHTTIGDEKVDVVLDVLSDRQKPFCRLVHFQRLVERNDPRVLVVAPMSGHHATLLRGTVERLLPEHDVFITDWIDAKNIPMLLGDFNLEDYISYLIDYMRLLGPDLHVIAVCQPAVPVLAAVALMSQMADANVPRSMTLMGGPIDAGAAETAVTKLAAEHPIEWFKQHLVSRVPFQYPGAGREVYPGFIQLSSFMLMNLGRHMKAHEEFFQHLVRGDGESAEKHRGFYDEYLAVMDVTAEFYLQTVERVFITKDLPNGTFAWRSMKVDCSAITRTALLTVEGELDDISAPGQTLAAHRLCRNLAADRKKHLLQPKVGHYGIFNGGTWRNAIYPVVHDFIRANNSAFG